jgi:hypothetical protein
MKRTILSVLIFCLFISCEYNEINKNTFFPLGTYKGQFSRSSPYIKYSPANVTLTFTKDGFSGESERIKYPAICHGTYTVTGNEIEFTDNCAWTDEFDWSYILHGKFQLTVDSSRLEMTKSSSGYTDHYRLELQ